LYNCMIVLHCHLSIYKHSMFSNSLEKSVPSVLYFFYIYVSSNIHLTNFRFFTTDSDDLQTLTVRFWRSSDSDLQLSFSCKKFCSHLFFQNQYLVLRLINFSLWSCTLEQILVYPIELLIPCYHQNLKGHC